MDGEGRPSSIIGACCYFAVMAVNDLLDNGQAKPCTLFAVSKKWVKDLFTNFRGNSMAVIGNPDNYLVWLVILLFFLRANSYLARC